MDNPEQILISAYLDEELNVEERARVEQLLARSAEARQLLDEMRALRGSLQSLPQHRLEIDFAQTVVQEAERQNAASQTTETSASISDKDFPGSQSSATGSDNFPGSQTPATDNFPGSESPATKFPRAFGGRGIAWSLVAIAAAVLITITTKRSDQNRQLAQRAEPPLVRAPAKLEQKMGGRSKVAVDQGELKPRSEAAAANQELPSLQPSAPVATDDRSLFKFGTPGEAKSFSASGGVGGKLSIQDQSPAGAVGESVVHSPAADSQIQLRGAAGPQSALDESQSMLVVRADISADAARQGAFDQLLAKNDITVSTEKQKAEPEHVSRMLRDAKQLAASPDSERVDVVYVEAGPAQIQNTLAELRKSPGQFSSVSVANVAGNDNLKIQEFSQEKKDTALTFGRATRLAIPEQTLGGVVAGGSMSAANEDKSAGEHLSDGPAAAERSAAGSADSLARNSPAPMPAPVQERALFVLRIVDGGAETDSAKPSASAAPSSAAQSSGILPGGK